jgi:circadian clock protein KaiC
MSSDIAPTGIAGLDDVLRGGFPVDRTYLVIGHPGSGKTTLGMQFLLEGVRRGEKGLLFCLSETKEELQSVADAHGWSLENIAIYDLNAAERALGLDGGQTMFNPSDVEFKETSAAIFAEIERVKPQRLVFDSLSELALLAEDPLLFRRELLRLKRLFQERNITALLSSDSTNPDADRQIESLAHGVVILETLAPAYGGERRRLRVRKLRGVAFRGGFHDYRIVHGGTVVYPRLIAAEHEQHTFDGAIRTGLPALDDLTGGGIARGSSTLVMGPAGCGKSSLVTRFAQAVLSAGESVSMNLFDESKATFLHRARSLGMPLDEFVRSGKLILRSIDPAEVSPGELTQLIREDVAQRNVQLVSIDSLNGYIYAMPEEGFLTLHIHELISYLGHLGVTTFLVLAQHGLFAPTSGGNDTDLSYTADTVIVFRFFEARGGIRRAISMLKKRHGQHEETIREYALRPSGIEVGQPLSAFHGVLTGVPTFDGDANKLGAGRAR